MVQSGMGYAEKINARVLYPTTRRMTVCINWNADKVNEIAPSVGRYQKMFYPRESKTGKIRLNPI